MKKGRQSIIMLFYFFLSAVFILSVMTFIGCTFESQSGLDGAVKDTKGNLIEGVQIASGSLTTSTKSDGNFHLAMSPGDDQIVILSHEGYVTCSKLVDIYQNNITYLPVIMMEEADAGQLDVTKGGTVLGSRGASLKAPPEAFVDSSGNPITGMVDVFLTPYDPAIPEEALAYPGELRGKTLDGEIVPLKTFGLLDMAVKQNGKVLQVKDGKMLDIQVPAPSAGEKPDTSETWYYTLNNAQWIQTENDATYDSQTDSYRVTITHLTTYNVDRALDPSCVQGLVVDAEGFNPVVGAKVTAQQVNVTDLYYNRGVYSETYTDRHGNYCMTVERDGEVLITVSYNGTETTRVITAGSTRSNDYPADCSSSSCLLLNCITVGTSDPGQNSDEANCNYDETNNPFTGTCALGLGNFYACFAPSGTCTYDLDWDMSGMTYKYEVLFENGSKMVSDFNLFSKKTEFYGPDPFNYYCGEMESEGTKTTITPKIGEAVTISVTKNGGIEVVCEYGFSFMLGCDQMNALIGCAGKVEDEGTGAACTPAEGSFMGPCTFDSDCKHNYSCCGPPFGEKKCVPYQLCSVLENSCTSDNECLPYGFVCCSVGWFDICLPSEACK